MAVRSNLPVPTCPVTVELVPGQPDPVICADDWNAGATSLRALQDAGRVIFEARSQRVNNSLYLPLSGYNANAASSNLTLDHTAELLPGLTGYVLVFDLKLIQATVGGNPSYQTANVIISDGVNSQTLASYTSNPGNPANIGAVFTTKIDTGTINANIMPQPGYSKKVSIRLQLVTTNSGTLLTALNVRGIFGVQLKQYKHCT